jgi:hypothetical protein
MLVPVQREEVVGMFPVQLDQEPSISPTLLQPLNEEELLSRYWTTARTEDAIYQEVLHAVREGQRSLSTTRKIAVSLGDCLVDDEGRLKWRNRVWVHVSEPLGTGIVQTAHLSLQTGHPGREETYRIVAREWYWPKMSDDIRRFVRNCELCRKSTPWRDGRHGHLRHLSLGIDTCATSERDCISRQQVCYLFWVRMVLCRDCS